MTQLEEQLHGVGIALNSNTGELGNMAAFGAHLADSTFSGYGSYRPITVRSYSMPEHADLERSQ